MTSADSILQIARQVSFYGIWAFTALGVLAIVVDTSLTAATYSVVSLAVAAVLGLAWLILRTRAFGGTSERDG